MANNSTQIIILSSASISAPKVGISVAFWLLLFGEVMAVPCYLFMFYHLFKLKITRHNLQNRAIILLLYYNFIFMIVHVSMTLDFLRLGYKSPWLPGLCAFQAYVDYGIWYGSIFLMLWISIERHILIFHSTLVATRRGRFLFHYVPLSIVSLYAPIIYFYLILFSCKPIYTPLKNLCGVVCFRNVVPAWFNWFESLAHYVIPILLIAVFSIAMIIRVIVQKRRLQRVVGWRQNRKMIIQLIFISMVYIIFDLPYVTVLIVQWSGIPNFANNISSYVSYLTYVPAILCPYTTLMALPKAKQKFHALINYKNTVRVAGASMEYT